MDQSANFFETLKQILRHARDPEALDDHPWVHSLFVQEARIASPALQEVSPGQQLMSAIALLFQQLQPSSPPRQGKRLDPRWGEFGLLAALYFTPFNHGTAFPSSFLEAWRRIDQAILYFVFGKPAEALQESDVQRYCLVGSEVEYGSASTLSDWHKKGVQQLSEILLNRERYLSRTQSKSSPILDAERSNAQTASQQNPPRSRRWFWWSVTLLILLLLGLGSFKGWKIYQSGRQVYEDVKGLQTAFGASMDIAAIGKATPILKHVQADLASFKQEARPLLWLSPNLSWVPVYGHDLASAPALIQTAEYLLNASVVSLRAAQPLLDHTNSENSNLNPADITALLLQAQPQLQQARRELDDALTARKSIDATQLSSRAQNILRQDLDPVLGMADDGLSLAMALPRIAGAASEGPKTYLLLVENEDELRPTGGFITSVGNLVVHNGQVISLDFEDAGDQEDWSKPYPAAPWQLQQYMNSRVLTLRDANWFTDFPTAALWAEYLYAYKHSHSVDGVIAFDQHFLVMLLGQLGPLQVDGVPYPLTADNVIDYMRQAKIPPEQNRPADWYRKEFIGKIAKAILTRLTSGKQYDWRGMAGMFTQALTERHLLLQFDDPAMAALLAEQGWDNALRTDGGDFLMVTDTNIGFNKTSAVVHVSLTYDVDLTNLSAPESTLTVTHKNNASGDVPCIQWNTGEITGEQPYPIDRCYWSYLRIYKQAGGKLLEATPHAIPSGWMLLGQSVPARVDDLEEEVPGIQGFGTLLVVPTGKSLSTTFRFALPQTLLINPGNAQPLAYRLHIQKQPGTLADPITIRIHLPNRAVLGVIPKGAVLQDHNLLLETSLRTDVQLEVLFTIP